MTDAVIKSEFHYQPHDGQITHKASQPTEDIILNRNAELRKNEGAIRDFGAGQEGGTWGRQVASIPEIMFYEAVRDGYQMNHTNQEFAGKELMRFLQSEKGKTCLVREKL